MCVDAFFGNEHSEGDCVSHAMMMMMVTKKPSAALGCGSSSSSKGGQCVCVHACEHGMHSNSFPHSRTH